MPEPTLINVFGANAYQTPTQLVISKDDLSAVGLTADSNNTAESLLASIIALAQISLSDSSQEANIDQSIVISDNSDTLVTRGNLVYRRKSKNIDFDKVDTGNEFDPDDY